MPVCESLDAGVVDVVDSDSWKAVKCGVVFLVHFAERHLRKGKLWREEGGVDCPEVTKSILFCWLFTIKDRCKELLFQQTHNHGFRQLFLMVS